MGFGLIVAVTALDITICNEVVEPVSDHQTQYQCDDGCEIEISDLFRAKFVEGEKNRKCCVDSNNLDEGQAVGEV